MAKGYHPVRRSSDPVQPSYLEANNNTSSESNNIQNLYNSPLNRMAIPIYTAPESEEDVREGGRLLLHRFIHREFENEGLSDDVLLSNAPPDSAGDVGPDYISRSTIYRDHEASANLSSIPEGYTPPKLVQVGSVIRELANEFAQSKERQQIRRQADEVDLNHINYENFFEMLNEIFRNGIDKHCIVALFFFCSDVLKRCVKAKLNELGSMLFWWSMRYVVDRVCSWVYANGGWDGVFCRLYNIAWNVGLLVAVGVVIACGIVWIKKNWLTKLRESML